MRTYSYTALQHLKWHKFLLHKGTSGKKYKYIFILWIMNNDSKKYGIRSWKKIKDRFFSPAVITFNYWRFEAKTAQSKFIYISAFMAS